MQLFVLSVASVLIISALCSLSEAALYAVAPAYVRRLADTNSLQGRILTRFKAHMGRPITAILIVNTIANTAGASIAGAQARLLFGEQSLWFFSAVFTLAVLLFSEILPKVAGVTFSRGVARAAAVPLNTLIYLLYPLVWLAQRFADVFPRRPVAPEDEVHSLAEMSAEEGSIHQAEARLVGNVLRLDEVKVRDIMTPRTVVFRVPADASVGSVSQDAAVVPHSRIPIHVPGDDDDWNGIVLRRDILSRAASDEFGLMMREISKPIEFVHEGLGGLGVLQEFIDRRQHLFGVVDEYGHIVGVVTLEDVLESLLGSEIVDETDHVVDMREEALKMGTKQLGDAAEPNGSKPASPSE